MCLRYTDSSLIGEGCVSHVVTSRRSATSLYLDTLYQDTDKLNIYESVSYTQSLAKRFVCLYDTDPLIERRPFIGSLYCTDQLQISVTYVNLCESVRNQ